VGVRFDGLTDLDKFHDAAGALSLPAQPGLHLWEGERLSDAATDAGLFSWLIDRTR